MQKTDQLNRIIFILSLAGILIAFYVLQGFIRQAPIICVNTGCELVRKNPASYLFGVVPVPAVGLVGYFILAICAFLRTFELTQKARTLVTRIMLGMGAFGVAFVSWFTYTEIFVIRGICTWCTISAVNMVVVFILTLRGL